jgi:hypothetical protein
MRLIRFRSHGKGQAVREWQRREPPTARSDRA